MIKDRGLQRAEDKKNAEDEDESTSASETDGGVDILEAEKHKGKAVDAESGMSGKHEEKTRLETVGDDKHGKKL
jgi:hypothetical protein